MLTSLEEYLDQIIINSWRITPGVKKSLVLVPGTSGISDRTSIYLNVLQTSKKFNARLFSLDKDKLFGNRTSKNFDVLARGTSEIFRFFYS